MHRFQLILASAALVAAASCDDRSAPTQQPTTPAAQSSSSQGGFGGSGVGAGGTEKTTTGGGESTGGVGGTGGGVGGTGGDGGNANMGGFVGTGGQGPCLTCSEYVAACWANGCPPKVELCLASIQPFSQVFGCFCTDCFGECEFTCSGNGTDQPTCVSCQQSLSTGKCMSAYATCQADKP